MDHGGEICMHVIVSILVGLILGGGIGAVLVARKYIIQRNEIDDNRKKMAEFYDLLVQWLNNIQEDNSIDTYLVKNGYKTVAIYGMKEVGQLLYNEIAKSDVEVKYVIDKNAENLDCEVPCYKPDHNLEQVDCVIVTAIHYFDEIKTDLLSIIESDILSVEDLVYGVNQDIV